MLDSDSARALSQMIGIEALDARQIALTAEITAQNIELALPNLNENLENAKKNLDFVQQDDIEGTAVNVEVTSDDATDGVLSLTYTTSRLSRWTPTYEIYLDRENSDYIDIQRAAHVMQQSGENWTNVNLTLSTLEPDNQTAPFAH